MTAEGRDQHSILRWIRTALPGSVVVLVVGSVCTFVYDAVDKARNAADAATTT
jgi:hypothetical protein